MKCIKNTLKKKEKPQGGVIMRIESIKNQTYPTYKTISFKDDIETETTVATQPIQPDTVQFKSAANEAKVAVEKSFLSRMFNGLKAAIKAVTTPDPYLYRGDFIPTGEYI